MKVIIVEALTLVISPFLNGVFNRSINGLYIMEIYPRNK